MPTWWVIHYLGNKGIGLFDGGVGIKPLAQWSVTHDRPETIAGYKWQADQWCRYGCALPQVDAGDPGFRRRGADDLRAGQVRHALRG